MEVYAPGVIKLFGEHAVVYGKLAVAATIGMYAVAKSEETSGDSLEIVLEDFQNKSLSINEQQLRQMYQKYKEKTTIDEYVKESIMDHDFLPYATIAARIVGEFGGKLSGKRIKIKSGIPVQKGFASSAACSTAFTIAALGHTTLTDAQIIDIARDGDRVIHKNENAGAIDVSATYFGGIVKYNKQDGASKEPLDIDLDVVLIDTGPKKSTAETVGHVAELYKNDRANTEPILERIDRCSRQGLQRLKENDFENLGTLMYENQEMLKGIGVSNDTLDRAVEAGKSVGAYGVKLSGGGGGGIAIAIGDNDAIIKKMTEIGFNAYSTEISNEGARDYIER